MPEAYKRDVEQGVAVIRNPNTKGIGWSERIFCSDRLGHEPEFSSVQWDEDEQRLLNEATYDVLGEDLD
jgi:hypothetical protein